MTGTARFPSDGDFVTVAYEAADGARRWVKRYDGGEGDDTPTQIAVGPSGTVYVTGSIPRESENDFATIAYDPETGAVGWAKHFLVGERAFGLAVTSAHVVVSGTGAYQGTTGSAGTTVAYAA